MLERGTLSPVQVEQPQSQQKKDITMAKKSRGGRMTAAKSRAAKSKGGKGPVKNRSAGKRIMST